MNRAGAIGRRPSSRWRVCIRRCAGDRSFVATGLVSIRVGYIQGATHATARQPEIEHDHEPHLFFRVARDRRAGWPVPGRPPAPTDADRSTDVWRGAYRFERDGWIYVHLEGSPERIGFQHGYLLADEIADFLRVIKPYLEKSTKRDWSFYRQAAEKMLWPGIDPEYQREIDGIVAGLKAKGVEADRWDLVALNANQELPYYYVPWLDKKEGKPPATHAPGNCSAFIASGSYTKDGRIVMGHNAWTNYVVGTRWNIIFDIKPEQGSRIIMDGLPGVIASDDDFGVNSAGIMVTETTITQFEGWDPAGKPEFARARKATPVQPLDRRLRADHARRQQRRLCQRLADRRQQDRRDRPLRAGAQEPLACERTKDGCFFGANFPDHRQAHAGRDQVRRDQERLVPQRPQGSLGAAHRRAQGQDRPRAGQGVRDRRLRRDHAASTRPTSGRSAAASRSRRAACPSGTGGRSTPAEPSSPR